MAEIKAVELRAELRQIKTMVDHSANIILNVPEDCREQVKVLFDWLGDEVTIVIVQGQITGEVVDDERRKRALRSGARKDGRSPEKSD